MMVYRRRLLVSLGTVSMLSGCLGLNGNSDTIESYVFFANHTGVPHEVSVTVENVTTGTVLESETLTVTRDENERVHFTETLDEDDINPEISATVGLRDNPEVEETVGQRFAPTSTASFSAFIKSDTEIDLAIGQE
ncbi:hypothetical protein [Halovivax gelatinilyticus]|uniref:hypothetical protein n=1 Tax=Halovivax gelatinilyticus TaxID=2961597 RepID=UPI0020CA99BD|nr:hypothetical protein [Halovivax gelatinilyticus]